MPGPAPALARSSCLTQVSYWILLTFVRAMIPTRLVLARSSAVLGVSEWAAATWAALKPSQLHALQASSRLLSLGIQDHAKHQEAPGKKPLSEKKLVSLSLGKTHLSSLSLPYVCVCVYLHARTCAHIPVEVRVKGRSLGVRGSCALPGVGAVIQTWLSAVSAAQPLRSLSHHD